VTGARRASPSGGLACRGGACFRLLEDGRAKPIACLADDLGRARRGRPLRWERELPDAPSNQKAGRGLDSPSRCLAGVAIRIHGLRIALRATTRAALARLCARLPPGARRAPSREVDRVYSLVAPRWRGFRTLYADTDRIGRVRRARLAVDAFESHVQLYVADEARRGVFVHAGVVGWKGRALVLPGKSGAGKTTLVAELIRAGATYYSDEYAVLDDRGRVHPYARLLAVRVDGGRQRRRAPEAFGARRGTRPLPVGLVVASRYRSGAPGRFRRLSAGAGALLLMANTVSARREPARALTALQAVVVRAPVLSGVRGEARETARALLQRLEAVTRDAPRPRATAVTHR
jgi:hypothetical protein